MNVSLNSFSAILYINLSHREQRNQEMIEELNRLKIDNSKITRIEGTYLPLNGIKGCALSHIRALDFAIENNLENVLILEDDCKFSDDVGEINSYIDLFFKEFTNDWDVLLLGGKILYCEEINHPFFKRVLFSCAAHSYAVNKKHFKPLRSIFQQAYNQMENHQFSCQSTHEAIDVVWAPLQFYGKWYVGAKTITYQSDTYSDIKGDIRKYYEPKPILTTPSEYKKLLNIEKIL